MLRKSFLFIYIALSLFLCATISQLIIPLEYSKQNNHLDSSPNTRHHLLRQDNPSQHRKYSRLSHNLKFINHYFSKQSEHSHQHHKLNKVPDTTHLKLQTFNLQPNTYSFSLPMKIAGIDYKMSIDSGSSDIFIKGEDSVGKPKVKYHCGQVCINTHDKYKIGYLDGHLQTYENSLEVEIGDHKFNESILVAYKVDQNFEENEGLVGLSFPQLASNPHPSFLQTLKNQKIIDTYAFGVNLNFQDQVRSFITFGSYDNRFFEGELNFLVLTSNFFYYVDGEGVSVGDSGLLKISKALFDTGNTCISIPKKYEEDILKQFNKEKDGKQNQCYFSLEEHANMFAVLRCKVQNLDLLPVLNIHLNGIIYPIEKEYYLQACDHRPKQDKQGQQNANKTWYCDTYIESVSKMSELFLGDGFFNRYYTYFNLEKKQIGIAKNKEVITMEKIIQNELEADFEDWENILTTLNPKQERQDIRKQILQNLKDQKKKQAKEE